MRAKLINEEYEEITNTGHNEFHQSPPEMTKKDKEMIAQANAMDYIHWYRVSDMAKEADTAAARIKLERISSWMYHKEEGDSI